MLTNGQLEDINNGFEELGLPEYMWKPIENYLMNGYMPGNFLTSILTNDLRGAFSHADWNNERLIKEWIQFMYWHMPAISQGSREICDAWIARFHVEVA